MAVSEKPWGAITGSDYADAGDFCDASLINLNAGPRSDWAKSKCKISVREPKSMGGQVNRNGVHAAAAVLAGGRGGVDAPPEAKRKAARAVIALYRDALKEQAPESVRRLAQG